MNIPVNGVTWFAPQVIAEHPTEQSFIDTHIGDAGTYPGIADVEAKTRVLQLVYKACSDAMPKPEAEVIPEPAKVEKKGKKPAENE